MFLMTCNWEISQLKTKDRNADLQVSKSLDPIWNGQNLLIKMNCLHIACQNLEIL